MMNKNDMQNQIARLTTRFDSFEKKLNGVNDYIEKQINYSEFKEEQRRSFKQMIGVAGVLITIIVTLTGWSFFEKGLYTPVPGENNYTVNANN